jgi:hypothetical protein
MREEVFEQMYDSQFSPNHDRKDVYDWHIFTCVTQSAGEIGRWWTLGLVSRGSACNDAADAGPGISY